MSIINHVNKYVYIIYVGDLVCIRTIYKDVQKWIDFLKNNSSNFPGNNFWY